jgi:lipopolysaccharide biosynthesis protein
MNEKQFTPSEIYNKMIAESLGFPEMAAMIVPPISHQGLRFHIKSYCLAFNKPMPKGGKRGRKPAVKTFKIKE